MTILSAEELNEIERRIIELHYGIQIQTDRRRLIASHRALSARVDALEKALTESGEVLGEIVTALRKDAPGTPLNNHKYDSLGNRAYSAMIDATRLMSDAALKRARE